MIFDLEKTKVATKLDPAPILEAIVEIRFESELSHQAVVDKLFLEFGKDYPKSNDLPLAQFPSAIRDQDPQLRYLPLKQLTNDQLILQIGGRVISLVNQKNYMGWASLKDKVRDMAERLKSTGVVSQYQRLGIRYLNTFDYNILDKVNIVLSMDGMPIVEEKVDFRINLEYQNFQATIMLSNNTRKVENEKVSVGSLVDIDAFSLHLQDNSLMDLIEGAHLFEKKLFFAVFKKDFIDQYFNPRWD